MKRLIAAYALVLLFIFVIVGLCAKPVQSMRDYTVNAYVSPRYNVVLGECQLFDDDSLKFKVRVSEDCILETDITKEEWEMLADILRRAERHWLIKDQEECR